MSGIVDFVIYNKDTGKILRTGACPLSMLSIQVINPNECVTVGKADDMCDLVYPPTTAIMRNFITTREEIHRKEEEKRIAELPTKQRELLIKGKMDTILRRMAINELVSEGKL